MNLNCATYYSFPITKNLLNPGRELPSQSCHLPVGGFVRKWAWTDGPGHGLPLGLNRRGTDGATHRLPKGRLTVEAKIIFSTLGMRRSKIASYLIFVTDATDGVRVKFFWPV